MTIRRAVLTAATLVVAVLVALAVPISQLRTSYVVTSCCCPDPDDCHCPPAPHDDGHHDAMKRCHSERVDAVAGAAPACVPPALAPVATPVILARVVPAALPAPHAAPAPARPDAPS